MIAHVKLSSWKLCHTSLRWHGRSTTSALIPPPISQIISIRTSHFSAFFCITLHPDLPFHQPIITMCCTQRWEYCCDKGAVNVFPPLDPDEVIRCSHWVQLLSEARTGDRTAKKRLEFHIRGMLGHHHSLKEDGNNCCSDTARKIKIQLKHVSEVLEGGTCVPDISKARHVGFENNSATDK